LGKAKKGHPLPERREEGLEKRPHGDLKGVNGPSSRPPNLGVGGGGGAEEVRKLGDGLKTPGFKEHRE